MDDMQALHELDAFATWQGGFDYYFAHVEDEEIWVSAREALKRNGFGTAASLFEQARLLFEKNMAAVAASPDEDETAYLDKVRQLDVQWRTFVPALHQLLAEWRKPRGLEEFGLPGW
jgi:hypothetical protein